MHYICALHFGATIEMIGYLIIGFLRLLILQ